MRRDARRIGHLFSCVGATALSAAAAAAQSPARDFQTYQPSAAATRIDASEAPVIDGDLSDPVWSKAQVIDEFYQLEPDEGAPASERTVARVLYDSENLYVSIYAYDSDPSAIVASVKSRDGNLSRDDLVRLYLDPGMTRRDGYAFEVNPLGARLDALIENNANYLIEWDALWSADARIVSDGYTVEIAIPTRALSFDPAAREWGFDLFRLVRRKTERIRWTSIDRSRPSVDISRSGTLTGIEGLTQGAGLDVQLYGAARYRFDHTDGGDDGAGFEPSGNVYYKLTPSLTGTLTFNTDFSDTPLDSRQVNTGRFSLFFPESRGFFLQDASVFEFGGRALQGDPNGRPFFSRRIGLVDGQPVDILAGAKLSGTVGPVGVGLLSVLTSGAGPREAQLLTAARVTTQVFEQSELGFIVTNGDPTGRTNNTVAGVDFQYRTSDWFDGQVFQADFFYQRSSSDLVGGDDAFGFEIAFPNEPFFGRFKFREIGKDFDPELGFVNRPGIRQFDGNVGYKPRFEDAYLRWAEFGMWWDFTTDLGGDLESRENGLWAGAFTRNGDVFWLNVFNIYEDVPEAFGLPAGASIRAGEYEWTNFSIELESSPARSWGFDVEFACCSFYDGDQLRAYVGLDWRPNATFDLGLGWSWREFDLPTGAFQIHILEANADVNFTPDMQLDLQVQYDNVSDALGVAARYRWEFEPGSELFLAVAHNAFIDETYDAQATLASIRVGHTLRF